MRNQRRAHSAPTDSAHILGHVQGLGTVATMLAALIAAACSGTSGTQPMAMTASGGNGATAAGSGTSAAAGAGAGAGNGATSVPASSASSGTQATASAGSGAANTPMSNAASGTQATAPSAAAAGASGAASKPVAPEMLDPKVDWKALKLLYPTMYSAYDGVHKFQVPVRVEDTTIELSGWSAIPSAAVQFDPDPEGGGVLLTVLNDTPEVTIAAHTGGSAPLGGTATLHVTKATPEEWALGQERYTTGADWEIIDPADVPPELKGMDISKLSLEDIVGLVGPLKLLELLSAVANGPPPAHNLKCTNCHSTGAKYFEVQHTPTQIAQISDADVETIFTKGMKPPGVAFRVLPSDIQPRYKDMHLWMATDAEVKGLIVYLRSLTPAGQGDILLPNGQYVPAQPNMDLISIILNSAPK